MRVLFKVGRWRLCWERRDPWWLGWALLLALVAWSGVILLVAR